MSDMTLNLNPLIHQYLIHHSVREHKTLTELRHVTHQLSNAFMQISPEQGQLMSLLIQLTGAKKSLDIGTFTGYSALVVALAMPTDGKVVTLDINEEWAAIGKEYWRAAKYSIKIRSRFGNIKRLN